MKKILFFLVILSAAGCRSIVYVPTVTVKDSLVYVNHIQKDSIYSYFHDSIYIHQKGDTVFVSKWHDTVKYRNVLKTDTVNSKYYINKEKTVTVNILTKFQKIMMWIGGLLSLSLIAFIVLKIRGLIK
jgi:hypothetical protein